MKRLTAKDIMTTEVLKVNKDWPVEELTEFLVENCISGAPVVDDNDELVGVVSLTDVARYDMLSGETVQIERPPNYYLEALEERYAMEDIVRFRIKNASSVTVADIMTPVTFKVHPDTPLPEVADTMIRGRIHRVLVTDNGQVVGIITALDMLKVIRDWENQSPVNLHAAGSAGD